MTPFVKTDSVVAALRSFLGELPTEKVPLDWLEGALQRLARNLEDESIVMSNMAIDHTGNAELISLSDLSPLEDPATYDTLEGLPALAENRYVAVAPLGSGGQGVVKEVTDCYLGRNVALKVLRSELSGNGNAARSFLREARIMGQLNHAGIVPIHDVGLLPDGSPCYSMRRIRGRSLREIFQELRELRLRRRTDGTAHISKEFTRRRLLEVLVSAAHTVGYAHDRGVLHRDLKPGNLMVGDYGEVLVLDWGVARLLGRAAPDVSEGPVDLPGDPETTQPGTIKGTPGYMAPEQAFGDVDAQGPWTDVYSLGLILYEMLLGVPARRPGGSEEALQMARDGVIESPETRRRREGLAVAPIPEELELLCMRCLERDPRSRFANGETVATALQAYLDGEQRREVAEERAREADAKVSQLKGMDDDIARRREEARLLADAVEPWMDLERKRMVWAREDEVRAAEAHRDEAMLEAFSYYTQALGDDPENARARAGLAQLNFDQLLEAEAWGRYKDARRYEAQVRRLDDGQLKDALQGDGTLRLVTDPPGAEAWLYDLVERDRRVAAVVPRLLGQTPLSIALPRRRYLVKLRLGPEAEQQEISYPILIRRLGDWEGHVRIFPAIPEGFISIAAGPFIFGGDRQAPGAGPREERWVEDFAISRFPVTCGQYLEFLRALEVRDPEEAVRRAPRTSGSGGKEPLWPHSQDDGFRIPRVDILGGRWAPDLPIRCVSRDDAELYSKWRGTVEGHPLRLPTELEWEKAGRGVDGRWFPWGNEFDASFCKMKDSRPGPPDPEPVGSFPEDTSPYGIQDLAGGVIEWCAGPFDRHGLLGIQKGGFWMASQASCRLARRFGVFPSEPELFAGFRLALTPSW